MKTINTISNYLGLIKQGYSKKDKSILFSYFISLPFKKLMGNKSEDLSGDVTIKSEDGIFFCGNKISSAWTGSNYYERESREYFELDSGNFIDVGANIGKFSVIVAKNLYGKVYAIEPHPQTFDILRKNIKLNNLKNVEAINFACSSKKGDIDLYIDERGTLGHSIKADSKSVGKRKIKVKAICLDDLEIDNVKLIKIDVEGAESDVLKGAKKILERYHPKIIFEAWDESYLEKVRIVLRDFNYQIKNISGANYFAE
ncbi:MAG: FkbM family methyltransferase [Actinobacteria bacterium]|nr:FkbM family methyltransferase [Actinomycetota bacterium]